MEDASDPGRPDFMDRALELGEDLSVGAGHGYPARLAEDTHVLGVPTGRLEEGDDVGGAGLAELGVEHGEGQWHGQQRLQIK